MAENTKIEWADHTFNPWIGCTKVSPACDHCYAEADFAHRRKVVQWGAGQPRKHTAPSTWAQPVKWNKEAGRLGVRYRVFCASLADVFDNEVPTQWRAELLRLIDDTPNLDWLLLTKRIGNANAMLDAAEAMVCQREWTNYYPRSNIWIGATICNQAEADRDIPKLLAVPAAKRFLSMEPLLGAVDISDCLVPGFPNCRTGFIQGSKYERGYCETCGGHVDDPIHNLLLRDRIDWVIVGGESGNNARPMHPDWARSLRDQSQAAGVAYLFKQWGEWIDDGNIDCAALMVPQITDPNDYFHECAWGGFSSWRVGKKAAGRLLDGREWNEVPA